MKHTLQQIKNTITTVNKSYKEEGFTIVGIFGSYARDTAKRHSDIDIAYTLDFSTFNQKYQGGFAKLLRIEEIKNELQKLLHLKVDLSSVNSNNSKFNEKIKKDMVYV